MTDGKLNNILIPNVTKVTPKKSPKANGLENGKAQDPNEFSNLLNDKILEKKAIKNDGIQLSTHAAKRLTERNLEIDTDEYMKLKGAMERLKLKGGQDSLIVTSKAAYIVDVPNNKIVTAIDKGSIQENVFTKIDSTVIV